MDDLRYPLGPYQEPPLTAATRKNHLQTIAGAVEQLRLAIKGLTPVQLDTPYRPGGWTVRQVVHHLPDSHMNVYIRCRMALTEEKPKIKTFDEARWAELEDARRGQVEASLKMLETIHIRWGALLRSLTPDDWKRVYIHPEHGKVSVESALSQYAWHTRHHIAHITSLRERSGWTQ